MRLGRDLMIAGVLCAGGCQQLLGLNDTTLAPDAATTPPPSVIHVSGSAYSPASHGNLSAVSITWMGSTGATATTTTDSSGAYALSLTGPMIDGYLHAQLSGYLDTDLYPAAPLAADATGLDIPLATPTDMMTAGQLMGVMQAPDRGFLGVKAVGAGGAVAGATVTTYPDGTVRYDQNGSPSATATSTDSDGQAYVFNLLPGPVTVNAMLAASAVFASHTVTCVAGRVTATLIQEAK